MFPTTTIKYTNNFNRLGLLCESLLFYKEVNVIVDYQSLSELIQVCGLDNLTSLYRRKRLNLYYNEHSLGAGFNPDMDAYLISSFEAEGYDLRRGVSNAIDVTQDKGIQAANAKKHLARLIRKHRYDGDFNSLLHHELKYPRNIIAAIKLVTDTSVELTEDDLSVTKLSNAFYRIECGIDNEIVRDACKLIASSTGLLYDGERYNSALSTNFTVSNYMEYKVNKAIELHNKGKEGIVNFHEIVLPFYLDISNTMDEGGKDFKDFIHLLNQAERFKEWVSNEDPRKELIEAYLAKLSETTWLQTKTGKSIRWILFTGAGLSIGGEVGGAVGTAISTVIDGFDDLLLDRILGDYKPNQFIDGEYKDYLGLRI